MIYNFSHKTQDHKLQIRAIEVNVDYYALVNNNNNIFVNNTHPQISYKHNNRIEPDVSKQGNKNKK